MTRPLLLLGICVLAAGHATAQETGSTSFTLIGEFQGGQYVWVNAAGDVNPVLVVPPSSDVTVTISQGASSAGIPHNLQVGGGNVSDQILEEGDRVVSTFRSPPTGEVPYVCTIHPTTMKGTVRVAGTGGGDGDNGTPGVGLAGLALALVLALAWSRRR